MLSEETISSKTGLLYLAKQAAIISQYIRALEKDVQHKRLCIFRCTCCACHCNRNVTVRDSPSILHFSSHGWLKCRTKMMARMPCCPYFELPPTLQRSAHAPGNFSLDTPILA